MSYTSWLVSRTKSASVEQVQPDPTGSSARLVKHVFNHTTHAHTYVQLHTRARALARTHTHTPTPAAARTHYTYTHSRTLIRKRTHARMRARTHANLNALPRTHSITHTHTRAKTPTPAQRVGPRSRGGRAVNDIYTGGSSLTTGVGYTAAEPSPKCSKDASSDVSERR